MSQKLADKILKELHTLGAFLFEKYTFKKLNNKEKKLMRLEQRVSYNPFLYSILLYYYIIPYIVPQQIIKCPSSLNLSFTY